MFEDINFLPGLVTYNDLDINLISFLKEMQISEKDLMQIEFPEGFLLDVGWRDGKYIICIIKNQDWTNNILRKSCKSLNELRETLTEYTKKIRNLIEKEKTKKHSSDK